MRSLWMRCLLAVVLIPLMLLGVFGGKTLLAHAHDGHGAHFHVSSSVEGALLAAKGHRLAHASGTAKCSELKCTGDDEGVHEHSGLVAGPDSGKSQHNPDPIDERDGSVITIPDHEQLVQRGIDLPQAVMVVQAIHHMVAWTWAPPDGGEEMGSPGGQSPGDPLHLAALTAGQRLVRTSKALLI